jgi:membrane protein implicated in regulation of membrane protease activity
MVVPAGSFLAPAQIEPLFGISLSLLLLVAGVGLMVAEALAPGAHFIVLGVALFVAGLVGVFLPAGLGLAAPLILAAVVLLTTLATQRVYQRIDLSVPGKGQTLSTSSLQGQFGTVTKRVTKTDGEVKLEDGGFNPYYQARSVEGSIEEGTEVMVVDPGGGNVITVEAVTSGDSIDRELEQDREESTEPETESEFA